jgi:hypothetical protein
MENLNKEIILERLHSNKEKIRNYGVTKLILFGSYAKDEQNESSDIDFLVEFDKKNESNVDSYLDLLFFLEDLFAKKIDLVKPKLVRDFLKPYILKGVQYEASI